MCGGGGSTPQAPDPLRQAEADMQVLRQQYDLDREQAEAEYARQLQQEEKERKQFDNDLGVSRSNTRSSINDLFQRTGLDLNQYDDRIISELDRAQAGISYDDKPAFSSDIGQSILDSIRGEQVKDYQRGINEFAPEGFERTAFAGTSDDAVLEAILGEQFGEASDSILRARDRGVLNDTGYNYASQNLEQQRRAASARLQDIGGGILEGYRGELGDLAGTARTGAGNYDFGDTFDPNYYRGLIEERQGELGGRLEGDIRNAIGGEQFFNTDTLIQKGGINQGAQNTGLGSQSGSLLGALTKRNEETEQKRGLGTAGSF